MYNPEKHHRRSVRLKNYCYNGGFYFVTVCCENRVCIFGKIKDNIMILNDYGKIAQDELLKTTKFRSNVKLHEFVIMPNHVHAILEINNAITTGNVIDVVGARRALPLLRNENTLPRNNVLPKQHILHLSNDRFQNQGKNTLSSVIGAYKSAVSKQIHEIGFIGNVWQRNYHEHIIRDAKSYQSISQYIFDNPIKWQDDELYFESCGQPALP